jgi:hypothetical protein
MGMKPKSWMLGAMVCIGSVALPVDAQKVYKCGSKGTVLYSEKPCSNRMVNTDEAAASARPNPKEADLRRIEQNKALARVTRPRPDETAAQYETRRRRAQLMAHDRDECARLDVRMPVEMASLKNPDREEVAKVEAALGESRKRFSALGC